MNRTKLGIIGKPLGHSLSPILHLKGMEKLNISYSYEKWEIEEDKLGVFIDSVKDKKSEILGFNVTIPYKEKIIKYLDKLDQTCLSLGAVNTVKYVDGQLIGYNTDGLGLAESLKRHGFQFNDKRILIIGSGGAARGIALFIAKGRPINIDITGRNEVKGLELSSEVENLTDSTFFKLENIYHLEIEKYDLIIQTTPVGMKNIPGVLSFPYEKLKPGQVVVDIVYNPIMTEFLARCSQKVNIAIGGLEMLVYQGYHSFKIWTGLEENTEEMLETGKKILEAQVE